MHILNMYTSSRYVNLTRVVRKKCTSFFSSIETLRLELVGYMKSLGRASGLVHSKCSYIDFPRSCGYHMRGPETKHSGQALRLPFGPCV